MKTILAGVALVAAAGCAPMEQRHEDVSSERLKDGGAIVLLSSAADPTCKVNPSTLQVRKTGMGGMLAEGTLHLNNAYLKSDFDGYYGVVSAIAIPAGDYYLALGVTNPSQTYRTPRIADFRVAAGEVRYLGNFEVRGCGDVRIAVSDKWSEVRSKFQERYPRVDVHRVRVQPVTLSR